MELNKEYFNCDNLYLANGINFATKERFFKFKRKEDGKEVYAFPKKDSTLEELNSLIGAKITYQLPKGEEYELNANILYTGKSILSSGFLHFF